MARGQMVHLGHFGVVVLAALWLFCACGETRDDFASSNCPGCGVSRPVRYWDATSSGNCWPCLSEEDTLYSDRSTTRDSLGYILLAFALGSCFVGADGFVNPAEVGAAEGYVVGAAQVYWLQTPARQDTVGTATVFFYTPIGGGLWTNEVAIYTARKDTLEVYGLSYRACRISDCEEWTTPLSFTVIDTLSR